ncbi:SDR family oxidoreductase [Salicibibacter cibarius]|uniref:SDR family oxidoreductase n=1 Tax=Salicibibacter cibarius TaxID=2743000 RepID=A0A7T6Z384_9BACI|nr:SDR family oxidoreductase [Salicibibacter cibarius]QQK76155.1 SDR family oxidoreductase [Salicibibacter cibarius]
MENIMGDVPEVDILINNLGIYEMMSYEDITKETWNHYFNTNFLVADRLSRFYRNKMMENDFGRIIFISSDQAVMPSGGMPQYTVTKSMILSLSKSLSLLTKGRDISVNTILPGTTLSDNVKHLLENNNTDPNKTFEEIEREFIAENIPGATLQKFIRPIEIGRVAAFLASPYSTAIRGAALRMEGGIIPTIV